MSRAATGAPSKAAVPSLAVPQVLAWRVGRQLLGAAAAARHPVDVAVALVGVQAQVVSSAALAIALRSKPQRGDVPAVDATGQALRDRRLVRSWAMRGTLHLLAAEDVPTIAAALGGKDNWRRPAWLRWFGVTEPEMDRLIDAVGEVLDDGTPRTRAELAVEIERRLGAHAGKLLLGSWGSALKVASDRHYLVQSAEDDAGVRFVRASRWIHDWRAEEPDAALARLVPRYLAAYGPATFQELLRWWGVARGSAMKPVIAALGDELAEVDVEGTRALVRAEDLDELRASRPPATSVQLVGTFDPLVVGGGLREHLIPTAHLKRVSRTAGWISPAVLVGGRVAGVWDSRRSGDRLAVTIDPFEPFDRLRRTAVEAAAAQVASVLGVVASVTYGRVFDEGTRGPRLVIGPRDA